MKYVLLGTLNAQWVSKQKKRTNAARAKAKELNIKLHSIYYTQGEYDFVDIVEAEPADILVFSMWYGQQGYGRIVTMPAFETATVEKALGKL
ncbi:MAG TPA: GYD domain-containing protein [Dongiaceae bacterium]|jgi:uncharacterized protein with GYD domain|nr:GYD domain-containing protein [Dongiaceae bacterium]